MKRVLTVAAALAFLMAPGLRGTALHDGPHVGPDDEVFKVGKGGAVKIATHVIVGDVLVKKGTYFLEHRLDAQSHVIVLTGEAKNGREAVVHYIRTRWIPSADTVTSSALFALRQRDGSYMVSVIQIAAESGDHVPW